MLLHQRVQYSNRKKSNKIQNTINQLGNKDSEKKWRERVLHIETRLNEQENKAETGQRKRQVFSAGGGWWVAGGGWFLFYFLYFCYSHAMYYLVVILYFQEQEHK